MVLVGGDSYFSNCDLRGGHLNWGLTDKWDQLCNVSGKRTPGCKCEQTPRAGGDLGTSESGRKISGAGAQWATGVPLRETRLQGAGAQTLGLHTAESGVWDLFSAHHKSDLSLSSAVSPGCGPTSWAGPQDPPWPAIASSFSTSPPTLWTLYTPRPAHCPQQ